ncbi:MAG: Thioredoxin reductase [Chlamydiae bacterium]|nr:Thioredoxin reductase [Chlamydiota bacterium]
MEKHKVIIIGSGPAGYTAAIYAARANLSPLLFEGFYSGPAGGQLMTTTEVENYPGFPDGITGPELMDKFKAQVIRFGTQCITKDVNSVDFSKKPFKITSGKQTYEANSVIIATGATAKRLDVEGTRDGEFWQKGVSACAVCDGAMPLFRGKDLFVIGGGDTAVEEALFLTKFARHVYVVHRRDELRASEIMAKRLKEHPKVTILWNQKLAKVEGNNVVETVTLESTVDETKKVYPSGGVFYAIGHHPNTQFLENQIAVDSSGYLLVEKGTTKTNVEGVFACGDVQDSHYRQAISAAGSGCMAALDAERWLGEKGLD